MNPGEIEYSYQNSYLNVLNLKRFGKGLEKLKWIWKCWQKDTNY